jgi:hypothetical protein
MVDFLLRNMEACIRDKFDVLSIICPGTSSLRTHKAVKKIID